MLAFAVTCKLFFNYIPRNLEGKKETIGAAPPPVPAQMPHLHTSDSDSEYFITLVCLRLHSDFSGKKSSVFQNLCFFSVSRIESCV